MSHCCDPPFPESWRMSRYALLCCTTRKRRVHLYALVHGSRLLAHQDYQEREPPGLRTHTTGNEPLFRAHRYIMFVTNTLSPATIHTRTNTISLFVRPESAQTRADTIPSRGCSIQHAPSPCSKVPKIKTHRSYDCSFVKNTDSQGLYFLYLFLI